ncbi:MAG TPA: CTP synthase, partial [Victivallales bacterium]|nr:CTP synthase [Victivallales bacterium]
IKNCIRKLDDDDVDIAITEIGGTAGDIESLPFLEAIRQFRQEIGQENGIFIHLTLVPYIRAAGEMKTKPSQQSVGILREIGIIPDILICRCEHALSEEHRQKLSLFCNVRKEFVIEEKDVAHSIYEVPIELAKQDLDKYILELFKLHVKDLHIEDWRRMLDSAINPTKGAVEIAVVGKYISLRDAYKSIYEALCHGGIANDVKVNIRMIESEDIERAGVEKYLKGVDGILVPGGFGDRGIEGKISAVRFARENNIPFFGICLGMQCAAIEFARNVCGLKDANSSEFKPDTKNPVITMMEEQKKVIDKGGTMRLGAWECVIEDKSLASVAYGLKSAHERHRHRYEFNTEFKKIFTDKGMKISGVSKKGGFTEIIELAGHRWFVACQFHPEFKSTPLRAHPLFREFIKASTQK